MYKRQPGFIDFIVDPTFTVLGDMLDTIMAPLREQQELGWGDAKSTNTGRDTASRASSASSSSNSSVPSTPIKSVRR